MKSFIILLTLMPGLVFCQSHLKNQKFLDIALGTYDGFSSKNYSIILALGKYDTKANANVLEFSLAQKMANTENSNLQVPVAQVFANYRRDYTILKNYNKTFIVSLSAKANMGYEIINRGKNRYLAYTLDNKSDYLLGFGIGPNLEYNNVHLGVSSNVNFLSSYQKLSTFPFVKYRIHF